MKRVAVVMAGGSGERFWPVSTPDRPKQLLRLTDSGKTMLEEAIERVAPVVGLENIYISTVPRLIQPIAETTGFPPERILAEPAKRNTAGALVWVAAKLASAYPDEDLSLAIITADQVIEPASGFVRTVERALSFAEAEGALVTIGISPSRPETGFGYIELGSEIEEGLSKVARFTEKPDHAKAEEFVSSGRFLWNSGMFFWTLAAFRQELRQVSVVHTEALDELMAAMAVGDERRTQIAFELLPNISIDYALMEQSSNVYTIRAGFEWDDVGAWDALRRTMPLDAQGNVVVGKASLIDVSDTVIFNEAGNLQVHVLGVDGLAIVVSDNKVFVCRQDRAQDVKLIVELTKNSDS